MISFRRTMEILIICAIPHVYPFQNIFCRMWMHNVDNDFNLMFMCCINQLFELFRGAKATWYTEKVRNMITEWAVIRMLHNSHKLNYIVTSLYYFWEYILPKVFKAMNFWLDSTHSNMALINFYPIIFPGRLWEFPFIILKLNIWTIKRIISVLSREIDPCGNSIDFLAIL